MPRSWWEPFNQIVVGTFGRVVMGIVFLILKLDSSWLRLVYAATSGWLRLRLAAGSSGPLLAHAGYGQVMPGVGLGSLRLAQAGSHWLRHAQASYG